MRGDDSTTKRLSQIVNRLLRRQDVAHVVAAMESGDRLFRWIEAGGNADPGGTPMRSDTPFFLASIDKLYNAVIALRLHERGLLGLDEPVAKYLPRSLVGGLHRLNGIDRTDRITVRHLLSHTSGLPDWLEDAPKGGRSLVDHLLRGGDRTMSFNDLVTYVRDRLTPHFPPQALESHRPRVRYSDTNFMLLVAIIQAVSAQPLHHVHEEMLYRPLNLRHTWIAGHAGPLDQTGKPAALWAGSRPVEIPLMMRSFWGMYSTAEDALQFLRALTAGRVFERPSTFALMQQQWNRFGLPLDRAALRSPQWPIEYGLGIMRFRPPRILTPLHAVPALIGHTGSTGCWLFHCPDRDLFLCGTVDQATAAALPFRLVPKLLHAVRHVLSKSGLVRRYDARSTPALLPYRRPKPSRALLPVRIRWKTGGRVC
jgi:CubicO group peptidase (beta-lactamase class C family)